MTKPIEIILNDMIKEKIILAIDFDGTCVTHEYPKVGRDIGAVPVLKELTDNGHKLMLWTMRSRKLTEKGVDALQEAIDWFTKNEIPLWGINKNPEQSTWTNSNKQYAHIYIDDAALGCPLIHNEIERPFVDWVKIQKILKESDII
jgi:hypothetical protein